QEGDDLALNDVTITGSKNTVGAGSMYGGAVYCYYQCTWDHVTIAKTTNSITDTSSPYIYGGAVYSDDYLKWSDVTVKTTTKATHTVVNLPGDGSYAYGGGFDFDTSSAYFTAVNLSIVGVTITVGTNGYVYGGGIYDYTDGSLDRATIAKVSASATGASSYIYGAGMYVYYQSTLVNSTIANNHAKSPATASGYGGYGGG